MIVGVGTDVCQTSRIARAWKRFGKAFLERVLTPAERKEKWLAAKLARRWALKEAVAKALGTGIGKEFGFQQIEVRHTAKGAPVVKVRGANGVKVHASVSDDGDMVVAFAVVEKNIVKKTK